LSHDYVRRQNLFPDALRNEKPSPKIGGRLLESINGVGLWHVGYVIITDLTVGVKNPQTCARNQKFIFVYSFSSLVRSPVKRDTNQQLHSAVFTVSVFPAKWIRGGLPNFWLNFISAWQRICRARYYAIARLSVCLSVRPSVTRVDQSKTVEVRIMPLSPQSSPVPLGFAV